MTKQSFFYKQQVILFICAGAGLASYFLPWASFPELLPGMHAPGGRNILTAILFEAALLAIFIRQWQRNLWLLWVTMACGAACLLVVGLDMQRIAKVERFYPQIGCLGSLAAAGALLIASLIYTMAKTPGKPVAKATDQQQLFAAYILAKSGKAHLLEGILERCRRDGISVHQHFEEGLVKNYDYSEAGARNMVAQWHDEFLQSNTVPLQEPGNNGLQVAAMIVILLAIAFIIFLVLKK